MTTFLPSLGLGFLLAAVAAGMLKNPELWGITDEASSGAKVVSYPRLLSQSLKALHKPASANPAGSWFWLSLVAFVLASGTSTWRSMLVLVPVLLLHELGHYAAMRAFGHDDARIFFLPFLGAITTSDKTNAVPWQRAIILLAGPLPGILLGALLMTADARLWLLLGSLLISINGINLLPIEPLDGGRFVATLLPSATGKVDVAFAAVTTSVGVVYLLATDQFLWAAVFAFTLVGLPLRVRTARLAAGLTDDYPRTLERCSEQQKDDLYRAALQLIRPKRRPRPELVASCMRALYERRVAKPPGSKAGAALALAYAGGLALAIAMWLHRP
jgi:Zn-dependent protease